MNNKRILGIDLGDKNIGLAVSDKLQMTAQPLALYRTQGRQKDLVFFKNLLAEHEIEKIVIGLPLRMNGSWGTRAEKTKVFAAWLEKSLQMPVILWDERLTTQQAFKILQEQKTPSRRKKGLKDQISATLILASYLENMRVEANDQPNN